MIDKANKRLTEAFGIPSFIWWRDDLNARLDDASDIKWSYPEICRATDVLQFLIKRPENSAILEAVRAITAYMGKQHGDDRDVKFKQVDLKRHITDLFVDIPVGRKLSRREQNQFHSNIKELREVREYLDQLYEYEEEEEELDFQSLSKHNGLAAGFLLHMPFGEGVSRFVLEGAPGQGKSTVTQFLCQVNRSKLLPARRSELDSVADTHVSAPTRTPFRVDLRDFAAWVSGRHPYDKRGDVPLPVEGQRSLESFLVMQITWHSGGLNLNQHDLLEFFLRAHSVVVLDGFDEVADITTRARVVEEICAAADRLDAHALSLQIIVTSRPAAFANSPGFPEDDWVHLELKDLKWSNIKAYQAKWSDAQDLTSAERNALRATLEEKLRQPHLRDLARNPMQLAILLQLMHVQGAALPDKRTALYEEYMKIFLNREVEKKQIAGDHRELILSIHGLLAWVLQVQAETGYGSGSITMAALKDEVATFLSSEEHDPSLAEGLLTGTVERVGALVSRVQGTFEFEVQPLREYFAARHLYKTAPYSPPGHAQKGTRPDRFAALARSLYWTNVTRFFCGFYDVGELPSLVDGLIEISEKTQYKLINQPRRLTMMLLGDYVFSQSPRSMRLLISFIARDPEFQRLTGADTIQGQRNMRLPETAGGTILFEACASKLSKEQNPSVRRALRQVMARNADRRKLKAFWDNDYVQKMRPAELLGEVHDFDLVDEFTAGEIEEVTAGDLETQLRWLAEANLHDHILGDVDLYAEACRAVFNYEATFPHPRIYHVTPRLAVVVLTVLLNPHVFADMFTLQGDHVFEIGRRRVFAQQLSRKVATIPGGRREPDEIFEFFEFVVRAMDAYGESWRSDLSPWEQIVDQGFQVASGGRLFSLVALISTAVSSRWAKGDESGEPAEEEDARADWISGTASGYSELGTFEPKPGLVRRLYFAKGKADDCGWWRDNLKTSVGEARIIFLATLMCWAQPNVIDEMLEELAVSFEELNAKSWSWFWRLFTVASHATNTQAKKINEDWFRERDVPSQRLVVALTERLAEDADRRSIVRRFFRDYTGGDWRILRRAMEWELLSERQEDIDWVFVKSLSVQARENDVWYLFPHNHVKQKVPSDVAKCILEDCEHHNDQLVSLCEGTLGSEIAQKATRVSKIAEEQKWFE